MGRTKKSESAAAATKALDAKSRGIEKAKERQGREKAQKSYREPSDSEEEIEKAVDPKDQDFSDQEEPSASEASVSEFDGESSGSEYGGKKKKKSPAKAVAKGRGRGKGKKAAASPKGKGRGRGRPAAAAKNGAKKSPAKRAREASDESESEGGDSSGSEYGKKKATPSPKKRTPAKKTPKAAAKKAPAASPVDRARRGRPAKAKSYKEISEDEELEVSEEEKPVTKRAKLEPKKKEKKVSEDEEEMSVSEEEEEKEEKASAPKKNGNGTIEKKKAEKDSEEDEEEDKKSEKSGKSDEESEEEEPKKKEKSPAVEDEEKSSSQLKNPTETDWAAIDFECEKKTASGDAWNFKISCWNIGGIKSWVKKNGLEYLKRESPDVLCLNEVKCNEKTKPEELSTVDGYPHIYWAYNAENSGQHGVAILSKTEPKSVEYGLPIADSDSDEDKKAKESLNKEGRLIAVEYENFYLVNAYVPNSGRAEKTDDYPKGYPPKIISGERQKFDGFFKNFVKELEKKKPVIVTGDLNVAHEEIDLANPKTNERTAGFTKEEREGLTDLLADTGLVDSFRALYPDKKEAYTFWSYMNNSRQKNIGWRLDYFLVSKELKDSVCENLMRTAVLGSDHCPIVLFIKN